VSSPALTLLDGVRWHGDPVTGERGHALLAALVLASPRAVGVGDLVDDVWADDEPEHPEKALQVLVSRTRARTAADAVVHTGAGYRIGLREDEVDALRLRRLVVSAREGAAAGDLDVVRLACLEAGAIDVTTAAQDGPLGRLVAAAERDLAAAGRLHGRALLARGESAEALPLLESALGDDSADEQRLADVLRAEANVRGVPAALARYASYVERTRDSLGAEPGEDLRRLHAELLARDAPVREGLKYDAAPMVGRDHDVAWIRTLLETSRVVSVVGPGGLGKTRMAHLVGRLAPQPVVHFVELAGVNAAEGVVPEVASALGVRDSMAGRRQPGVTADLRSRIAQHLAGPPTLLILDNCEHLVDEVASLVAFLAATTETTSVLTTSRAPLGIAAEQVYLLPQLDDTDAALLFRQRATAARRDVRLDAAQVAQLVARLDGLPLAIELAAAKVRVMSVAEIARRLEDRFTLLTGGDRSAPERHQTLEAVIDWSWNLLDEQERTALRALAMFPDGFSLAGADAVLGRDALSSLAELVDQSLVVVREGDDVRYRLLETVREYGLKQLAAAGGTEEVRGRLRAWAVGLARELLARLFSPDQVAVMGAVRAEVGNLAGVMRAALAARDAAAVTPLVAVLGGFWTIEGEHLTVLGLSRPVLELLVEADTPEPGHEDELRGVLVAMIINTTIFTGDAPVGAVAQLRALGVGTPGSRTAAMCRVLLDVNDSGYGDLTRIDELTANEDPAVSRLALQWASQAKENAGDVAGAIEAGQRALQQCDDSDGPWTRALICSQLCGLATQVGDWPLAVRYARESLPVMEALGAAEDAIQLRSVIALADLSAGRLDEAAEELDRIAAGEHTDRTIGWSVAGISGQAELALARGEVDRGLSLYRECIDIARNRRMPGIDIPVDRTPWVMFAASSAVFAHVLHGRREAAADLASDLRGVLPQALDENGPHVDFPVCGGGLLALGTWDLTGGVGVAETSLRMTALGQRFGYHRTLPTMAWANVLQVLASVDPAYQARVEALVAVYAARSAVELRGEALGLVAR